MQADQNLGSRLAAGEEEAYQTAYERYKGPIYSIAYRICQCEQEALDVLQETFIQAFTRCQQFRGDSLWGWLRQIAVNQCISRLRKLKRMRLRLVDDNETAASVSEDNSMRMDLAAAFANLSADTRAVVWLYDVEGYSHQEIAAMFGRSVSFSKTQVSRAHRQMRGWLGQTESDSRCQQIAPAR